MNLKESRLVIKNNFLRSQIVTSSLSFISRFEENWRSQFVTSNSKRNSLRSQIATIEIETTVKKIGGRKLRPPILNENLQGRKLRP